MSGPAPAPVEAERRAGLLVRAQGELRFLPASLVRKVVPAPTLSDVSGTGLTMSLVDGQVLLVLTLAARGSALVVCEVERELIGMLGAWPEDAGFFEASPGGVQTTGGFAADLDVAELLQAAVQGLGERPEAEA